MATLLARAVREAYRRELLPPLARWALTAAAMRDWVRGVERELRSHLGSESRSVMAALCAEMLRRRYRALCLERPLLPSNEDDPRALPLLMSALYQLELAPRARWMLEDLGGAPRGAREAIAAQRLALPFSPSARWRELAGHLGELLIVITERLPARLPRARQLLAEMCFRMGVRYGEAVRRSFSLPEDGDAPAQAIEVLRMGEYLFHVNPEHWHETDPVARRGFLEGTACLWYLRPGWDRSHCGIFGQFQSGVCSVFGLDYKLDRTIPKHGGETCKVTLRPLRRSRTGPPLERS